MQPDIYQQLAELTENKDFDGIRARLTDPGMMLHLCSKLRLAVEAGERLDRFKKTAYYGKEYEPTVTEIDLKKADLVQPKKRLQDIRVIRLLHAGIGMATEAAELLDMLARHIFDGKKLDIVNAKEELGDGQWYIAEGCNATDSDLNDIMTTNIDKLRARYPEKFTEFDAQNRNLAVEREILEGKKDVNG